MKYFISLFLFLGLVSMCHSQVSSTDSISLDLLNSAGNPAFNMLGLAESDIHRPTDLSKLAVSLRTATNNLTVVPKSFGLELAPFLLAHTKYTLDDFDKKENTFKQTFSLSIGFSNLDLQGNEVVDSLKTQKLGFGMKFSIIRAPWSRSSKNLYSDLINAQRDAMLFFESKNAPKELDSIKVKLQSEQDKIAADTTMRDDEKARKLEYYDDSLGEIDEQINNAKNRSFKMTTAYSILKSKALKFKNAREGLFLDFVSGLAIDFPTNRFEYSLVHKAGAWLTGGYENGNKGISSMAIARYLYQPQYELQGPNGKVTFESVHSLDIGARLLFKTFMDHRFAFSSEYIYRSFIDAPAGLSSSWRLVFNAEYDLGKNQKITFAFGKNFDGEVSKTGNLVSLLNFVVGLGTNRRVGGGK